MLCAMRLLIMRLTTPCLCTALFERYPYLINLPSLFYRIGGREGSDNQSIAFSMIFTVHAFVIAAIGFLSLLLTMTIGASAKGGAASPLLYAYLATLVALVIVVLLQYRRIYIRFTK